MSHGKQFTLYSHTTGPNGWKVVFVLEELGLSYETIYLDFNKGEHKAPEYTKYNPNGRIPALIDHKNNDFVIWESNAILIYLVDKYDKDHRISASTDLAKYEQLQWLIFQASGQGPYFGQSAWFNFFNPEKLQGAIDRYNNEVRRVLGVLDGVLAKKEYLVEDRLTISDMAFVTWNNFMITAPFLGPDFNIEKEYPAVARWHNKLLAFPSIKKVLDSRKSG